MLSSADTTQEFVGLVLRTDDARLVYGNRAIHRVLKGAHATFAFVSASATLSIGLPRCWAISSAGNALK